MSKNPGKSKPTLAILVTYFAILAPYEDNLFPSEDKIAPNIHTYITCIESVSLGRTRFLN